MAANILIVDDSRTMRSMLKRSLEMSGLDVGTVYEAGNGIEALAQASQHDVDVILLDINMPVMNGEQLVQRIKDDDRLRDLPVIIASTEGSETRIQELLGKGAKGYLRKPIRPEQLLEVLSPFVDSAEQPSAAIVDDDPLAF